MRIVKIAAFGMLALTLATPAGAQFGSLGKKLGQAAKAVDDLTFTEAEETQLGSEISTKLRDKYGVVQDKAVHKYVTLVGTVLAQASSRPNLKWTFVVLDTDGVNAFAAPGGFVHITRGALALIQDEAELADVLGHEITHVTAKHTLNAITKAKVVSTGAQASRSQMISQAAERGYAVVLENSFDRKQEMEADATGVRLANAAGYAPTGLAAFLTRLADRNKNLKDRSGMFASHPETQARVDGLKKEIAANGLDASATVAARYKQSISYQPATLVGSGENTAVEAPAKPSGSGKLGLGGLARLGSEKSNDQTVSSAGSRGVNPDRDAKGGPVKTLVAVSVTPAEVAQFKTGITG